MFNGKKTRTHAKTRRHNAHACRPKKGNLKKGYLRLLNMETLRFQSTLSERQTHKLTSQNPVQPYEFILPQTQSTDST